MVDLLQESHGLAGPGIFQGLFKDEAPQSDHWSNNSWENALHGKIDHHCSFIFLEMHDMFDIVATGSILVQPHG